MLARIAIAAVLATTVMATSNKCNTVQAPKESPHTSGKVIAHSQNNTPPFYHITFQPDDGTAPQTKRTDAAGYLHCDIGRRWPKCQEGW